MGTVTINPRTIKDPITFIGEMAGECWGADTTNKEKNYKRGLECLRIPHGRALEYPDIYATLDGYSARVIREWYTHIGGAPTRLQASTRYIKYSDFNYTTPPRIKADGCAKGLYDTTMKMIATACDNMETLGIPREDAAMVLPLGMSTKIVDKRNLRNLIDMSRQRECTRTYWEFRDVFDDYKAALSAYSDEWKQVCDEFLMPKCKALGYCPEKYSCGEMPKKDVFDYYMSHVDEIKSYIEMTRQNDSI